MRGCIVLCHISVWEGLNKHLSSKWISFICTKYDAGNEDPDSGDIQTLSGWPVGGVAIWQRCGPSDWMPLPRGRVYEAMTILYQTYLLKVTFFFNTVH